MKYVRIGGVPDEIRTGQLLNINQEGYRLGELTMCHSI
jgi:hypothetical protein